jgi:cob(I)alamin adenosyltransferase
MKQGLVIVYTGNGKGKTTAALGLLFRAWGRDMRICVVQFIKAKTGSWGEIKAARKLGIEWHTLGDGFTWRSSDLTKTISYAKSGWELAQEKITSNSFDVVILDEFTYPLQLGWLGAAQVIDWLAQNKPNELNLVITGRNAPQELIEYADLVTEMNSIKHPFDKGIKAKPGIDF